MPDSVEQNASDITDLPEVPLPDMGSREAITELQAKDFVDNSVGELLAAIAEYEKGPVCRATESGKWIVEAGPDPMRGVRVHKTKDGRIYSIDVAPAYTGLPKAPQ